jgi:hypothetical protein
MKLTIQHAHPCIACFSHFAIHFQAWPTPQAIITLILSYRGLLCKKFSQMLDACDLLQWQPTLGKFLNFDALTSDQSGANKKQLIA